VKNVRVRIQAVGPNDRARLNVDPHLPEVGGIAKWLSERAAEIV
jgi:hypothetical protein